MTRDLEVMELFLFEPQGKRGLRAELPTALLPAGRYHLMIVKGLEGHARRSAFVLGIVSDEEENKMEIVLDPVRASRALTHTLKILFIFQKHGGARGAPTPSASPSFFSVSVVQESETCWAGVGVGHTEVEAAGTAVCLFHTAELSALLMEMRRVIISAPRG